MAGTGGLSPNRVRTSLAWPEFLAAVDSTLPAKEVLEAAAVFFSAKCSDDDPYITVVKYSWGTFNPANIEANEKQLILHMAPHLRLGGFWLPSSWSSGRYYAYDEGCFKVTAASSIAYDSGWVDDSYPSSSNDLGWQVTNPS